MAFIHHQLVILVNNCALPASQIRILLSFVVCVASTVPARLALKHVRAAELFRMGILIVLCWRGKDKLQLWGRKKIKYLQFCGAVQVPEAQAFQEHKQHFWAVPLPLWELRVHWEKKGQLSFSPMGKWLIERWVGRKWALENPLCFLARCLPDVRAVRELIYNLSGKLGNLTKIALPTNSGGKQEVAKETSHCLGVTFGHSADAQAAGAGFLFLLCVEQTAATAVALDLGVPKRGRSAEMFLPCLNGVISP